ncbi:hypothetical protein GLAREA_07588 [Glarea lozoyensis ATCC 20868]|uniref:Uncharacterized protein n=1 Tax=Glarea lozoyensis (strain ATCC 20868 / MF5171) TaxID=1116229 RepID=S3D3T1_GLAL2|nr:uncharacterized protein GLAREA_07588 [Glarea lozoyensis ATCC 20868]EPE32455.1 hypothetical protein GLAREA_07588 [Glarea lozoyensis ATCC 20868]
MAPKKQTYYTYSSGIPSKNLHLGNLTHNFRDPGSLEPFVFDGFVDPSDDPPEWAQVASLENYAMTLGKGEGKEERYKVVAAAKTTRMEIIDSEEFFTSTLLPNPQAKSWLKSRISASQSLPDKPVEVWMLTGLILMTHATWTLLSAPNPEDAKRFTPGLASPFDPAAVESLRRLSVSEGVKPTFGFRAEKEEGQKIAGVKVVETGKFPGVRAWAGRWERVAWDEGVRLQKGVYAENGEGEEDFDDDEKFWDGFLEKADELTK